MSTVAVKDASGSTVQLDVEDVGGGVLQIVHRFVAPSAFYAGALVSTGAASNVQGGAQALTQGVWVKALAANILACYVGPSGVGASGEELSPGEETFVPIDNLNKVYVHFLGASPDAVRYLGA